MPVPELHLNGKAEPAPSSTSSSSSSKSKSKSKTKLHLTSNVKELAKLLAYEERETKDLHRAIITLTEQLNVERQRASDAEDRVRTVVASLKSVNETRLAAVKEAAVANEQLKLYKTQLEAAQNEIFRAQDLLHSVDERRFVAETEAAKSKQAIRKMNEEILIWNAREEGRRAGIAEGIKKGRNIGYREGRQQQQQNRRRESVVTESEYASVSEDLEEPHYFEPRQVAESVITQPRPPPTPESVKSPAATPRAPVAPMPADPLGPLSPIGSPLGEQQALDSTFSSPPVAATSMHSPPPQVYIIPDNFIPTIGSDSIIRLPPPHEMAPPTPRRTPIRPPVEIEQPSPVHYVPPPRSIRSTPVPEPITTALPPADRARYSPESSSTTISQNPLVQEVPLLGHRPSRLSDITEVLSTSTPSPHPNMSSLHPSYYDGMRSPQGSVASQNLTVHGAPGMQRRGSVSSARSTTTVPDINIEPPSQRSSLASAEKRPTNMTPRAARSMGNLLSPEDALRPLSPPTQPKQMDTPDPSDVDNHLPPGFMPSHSVPQDHYQPHYHSSQINGGGSPNHHPPFYPTPESPRSRPVIPEMGMMMNMNDSMSSDSVSTPASSAMNTLMTPPVNRLRLAGTVGVGAGIYAAKSPKDYALPESVVSPGTGAYRSPYSNGYASEVGMGAAGVPLPASTVGMRSPGGFSSVTGKSKRGSKKGSVTG